MNNVFCFIVCRTQRYLGELKHGAFDERTNHVYIATKENVLASVNVETGNIIWRQVLERGDRGTIHYLHLIDEDQEYSSADYKRVEDRTLVTVSGTRQLYLVRGWNARTGNVLWEWTIPTAGANLNDPNVEVAWFFETNVLYQATIIWGSHIDLFAHPGQGGQPYIPPQEIDLKEIKRESCVLASPYLICENAGGKSVSAIDLSIKEERPLVENVVSPKIGLIQVFITIWLK